MKILCLYRNECSIELWDWLASEGHEIVKWTDKLDNQWIKNEQFDLAVSYTYTYIVKQDTIDELRGNIVNLHISFLPYNRGAYPNIWGILDGTPRGVTLHYLDAGIDTGDIIAQTIVPVKGGQTLRTSYEDLDYEAKCLFKKAFVFYDYWNEMRKKAVGVGTYHTDKDFKELSGRFHDWTYDIDVNKFERIVDEKHLRRTW